MRPKLSVTAAISPRGDISMDVPSRSSSGKPNLFIEESGIIIITKDNSNKWI